MLDQSPGAARDATDQLPDRDAPRDATSAELSGPHPEHLQHLLGSRLAPRPTREQQEAIRQRVNDEADLRAFTSFSSARDAAWIRGLAVASRDIGGVPVAVQISEEGRARLGRIAEILERSERDARLSPLERLGRELSSVVVQEILHNQREASRG
jgi:hypothetical protein